MCAHIWRNAQWTCKWTWTCSLRSRSSDFYICRMTAFIAQLDWCTLQKELGRVGGSLCQAFKQWRGATCGRTYVDKQAHPTVVVARETAVSRLVFSFFTLPFSPRPWFFARPYSALFHRSGWLQNFWASSIRKYVLFLSFRHLFAPSFMRVVSM